MLPFHGASPSTLPKGASFTQPLFHYLLCFREITLCFWDVCVFLTLSASPFLKTPGEQGLYLAHSSLEPQP